MKSSQLGFMSEYQKDKYNYKGKIADVKTVWFKNIPQMTVQQSQQYKEQK